MAILPSYSDSTLEAVDREIEKIGNAEPHRPYLGMSEIGRPCSRALWYGFHWCSKKSFDAKSLKRFEDGHHGEDVQAYRLRLIKDIDLLTLDPHTGQQFGFSDHSGHFKGHMDGIISGLLQAPKTQHVWEHKQTDSSKQNKLLKLIFEKGEKDALQEWNEVYFAQAVLYMYYGGFKRHYLTCASSGGRETVSVRTNVDKKAAQTLIKKAKNIIRSPEPLERISQKSDFYLCKFCDHHAVCHTGAIPAVNCRTCLHSTPEMDGHARWSCAHYGCDLTLDHQRQSKQCLAHRFIPYLLPFAVVTDANDSENWIEYEIDGVTFKNGGTDGLHSPEIRELGKEGLGDSLAHELKKPLAAPRENCRQEIQMQNTSTTDQNQNGWLAAQRADTTKKEKTIPASVVAPWTGKV